MRKLNMQGPEGRFFFELDPDFPSGALENAIRNGSFVSAFDSGKTIKDSKTCTISVNTALTGHPVFAKRTKNKGMRFTVRYLFRRARAFRAAAAAQRLIEIGVLTPRALLAGECRFSCFLKNGFLITEFFPDAEMLSDVMKKSPEVYAEMVRHAAEMHRKGIFHGDLKLQNVFRRQNKIGVWDLDGARIFDGTVPPELRRRDLARLAASGCRVLNLPDAEFPDFCRKTAEIYNDGITAEEILPLVQKIIKHVRKRS